MLHAAGAAAGAAVLWLLVGHDVQSNDYLLLLTD